MTRSGVQRDPTVRVTGAMEVNGSSQPGGRGKRATPRPTYSRRTVLTGAGDTDLAWSVLSYLVAGMLVWGGLGWVGDRLLGQDKPWLVAIGVIVGVACGVYLALARHSDS